MGKTNHTTRKSKTHVYMALNTGMAPSLNGVSR